MRLHARLVLLLPVALAACGGQVGDTDRGDAGDRGDASTLGPDGAPGPDATAPDSTSPPRDASADAAPVDAPPDGVVCGILESGAKPCVPCPASQPSGACTFDGVACEYPGMYCLCTNGCTSGGCCPKTCAQLGFPCAPAGDGCGGVLNCRQCPAGQTCGRDGGCEEPGAGDAGTDACTPAACGGACGVIDDGCGGKIDCGACFWDCVLSGP
jgi:hypothetical protein